jgi:hypothetical protein
MVLNWKRVRRWMDSELAADGKAYADSANVLIAATLAEAAAAEFDCDDELDDETSLLWDFAADAVDEATRRGGWNT